MVDNSLSKEMIMTSQAGFLEFSNSKYLVQKLSTRIIDHLSDGIKRRGQASLAVSGGTTPVPLFQFLSRMDLEWGKVVITLVDERWVDVTEGDSNEHLVRTCLLQNKAASALFSSMKIFGKSTEEAEQECSVRYQSVPMPFDVVILGMGSDGHTASLFPGAENLAAAVNMHSDKACMSIIPAAAPHERMTLTLPAILNSRDIIIHITGEEKRKVYDKAVSDGPSEEMPIRYVLRQKEVPVTIYWCP